MIRPPLTHRAMYGLVDWEWWKTCKATMYSCGEICMEVSLQNKWRYCIDSCNEQLSLYFLHAVLQGDILMFILLLLSNRALYWFTTVGSETVFYSNKCYKLPDLLLHRTFCYFPPKSPDTLCVPRFFVSYLTPLRVVRYEQRIWLEPDDPRIRYCCRIWSQILRL